MLRTAVRSVPTKDSPKTPVIVDFFSPKVPKSPKMISVSHITAVIAISVEA